MPFDSIRQKVKELIEPYRGGLHSGERKQMKDMELEPTPKKRDDSLSPGQESADEIFARTRRKK